MSDKLIVGGYTLISIGLPDLLPQSQHRTPGIHVSDIIRYLCIRLGHFEDDNESNTVLPPSTLSRMQIGCAIEDALSLRYHQDNPDRYIRIGEIERDGIYGHPDLIDCHLGAVKEFKATWVSTKSKPGSTKFWKWEVQLKAYCYMIDLPLGHLQPVHMNGDYKWGKGPESGVQAPIYERRFTDKELRENWEMLLTNAEKL